MNEKPTAEVARSQKPVSPAAAILRQDFDRRRPPPAEPEPPSTPPQDEFDDEYLCPYCAAKTQPDDRKCPACGSKLWVKIRRREERSSWLWVALSVQMAITFWPAAAFLAMLAYAADKLGIANPLTLVPAYLGLPGSVPPEVVNAAFELVPRPFILVLAFYLPLSLTMFIGLYLRWKPIFFMLLFSSLLTFVLAGAGMALHQEIGLTCGGGGVILALLMALLLFQLEDDFFFDEKRILLSVDRGAKRGLDFFVHGRRYARQKMWAMAAIHLRRAVAWLPGQIDCHLELAVAYTYLKRYDLAAEALAAARRINPDDPRVEELAALLGSLCPADSPP